MDCPIRHEPVTGLYAVGAESSGFEFLSAHHHISGQVDTTPRRGRNADKVQVRVVRYADTPPSNSREVKFASSIRVRHSTATS
jgi:hypothetical protein